ncbi:MAG TPA: PVC-type heme-binding CxxCH protein [Gemmataceae bacterium]|nr:PVC-type heme-binding CxxCH protein [Gemmataceae bacterium]
MKRRSLLLCLGLCLALVAAAPAQVPPDKALATFQVADGLQMSLWASEPLFCNPTCMDIDHKGRVWVCESVNYRCTLHGIPLRRPQGDRILILEDSKGTGHADKVTVFYQAPDVLAPLGIAVAKDPVGPGYKVFVCQSPNIWLFEDKDGDGHADGPPRKLLTGFRGIDHDHGVHGIFIGPDMKLYFSVGDQGVQDLQSADGKGRKWTSNEVDCTAGTVWRCDLDGTNLELIAHNFRNEYEPCCDSFGTIFVSDNDDDGNQQTRICYVMPGGNYGYHPRGPNQTHWHEEQPGVVPKILRTYFGSPTGMCVYEGTLLPKRFWGQPLHTDAGPRQVRCYHLTPDGAGYDVGREDIINSTDTWFRPSDVCVAPDGSVYVADWYDPGVGGHGIGDFTRGRIYRLAPPGNRPSVPKVDLDSKDGILAALGSPNRAVRYMAMAKLQMIERDEALAVLKPAATQTESPWLRARAVWQQARLGQFHWAVQALTDRDPRFRVLGLRAHQSLAIQRLSPGDRPIETVALNDHSPAARREALLSLRGLPYYAAGPVILGLAKQYDGKDRFYLEAIGIAVGHHDKTRRAAILADFEKEFPDWNDKVADLVWELQPPQMLSQLEKRAQDANLSPAQRARAVEILGVYQEPEAGKTLLRLLAAGLPPQARDTIIKDLKTSLSGKWHGLRQGPELEDAIAKLLDQPDTRATALALIQVAERGQDAGRVAAIARDPKQPLALRVAAVQTLGSLPSADARKALQGLLTDASSVALRPEAVRALAGSRGGSEWLLAAAAKKQLPDYLKDDAGRLLRNSPYKDLKARAFAAFPAPGAIDPKKLPDIAVLARRRGNPLRGKQLLTASATNNLQCLKCHTVRGVGGSVGPDLSMIGKKASRENLFESILYPSKAVADQYLTWNVETSKGLALSGLLVEETADHVTLRDANGKDTRVSKDDIESRSKSPTSLMPNNLVAYMTADDLVDLVEYLFSLKTPALAMDYWHVLGPFENGPGDAGLDRDFGPEKGIDLHAGYTGKTGPVHWRTVKPNAQGYVDLQAFFAPASDDIVSYLYREIDSPADQEALVFLGTDDAAKLAVNDEVVWTSRAHRAAAPEQDVAKVRLKKGRNRLLLKITNGDGAHGFYFTLLAEQEVKRVEDGQSRR